ncbi:HBR114Wp [Eremothecium sinecaudum]|uniref:Eukaryotic peptide chain release factor GTP-binding subunit n=1 Tax=Eremothecium sinecaudum TaxID=45286 RepID=A0A125RDZ8_9SACH|nr:HBR114Wp [Eremothecium sinecaudum]AMD19015.1 HBR114Wp [Eremothecium sinecaudum]
MSEPNQTGGQGQQQQNQQSQQSQQPNYNQYYNQQGYYPGYPQYNQQGGYQVYQQYNQQYNQQGYQAYQSYSHQGYNANQNKNNNNNYHKYQQQQQQQQQQRAGYQAYQPYNPQQQQQQHPIAYQQYQPYNPQQQTQGVSLNNFEANAAPKPKKTLKLASTSGIKLVGAKKPVVEKEESNKGDEKKQSKPADSSTQAEKKESLPKMEELKIAEEKQAPSNSEKSDVSLNITSVDALIKEQEDEVDEDVVKDMYGGKDHVSIIFMGHVDAGKSTMGGNLLYLTGSVDKRTVEKYEREAKEAGRQGWYLSWIMDTNKEERNDGKTIEVGKSYFETEKRRYTILDAPGHKMYVSEMIGGASQADIGILVISARKGEYETGFERGGQTREHALLAKTQGVNKMVVVVNKMDDPTVNWDQERFKQCVNNVSNFLKAIGYNVKDDVMFMPVSGYTGAGLKDRVKKDECPWYNGPSLLEYLDEMKHVDRFVNAPFMLPIAGKMKDMGTVVEGKIESGHISKGSHTLLMPNKIPVEILGIQNETEQEVNIAVCGEQVRLRLKGVEEEDISAGFVLTSPKNPIKNVTRFVAQIAIVELKSIMSAGFSCVMHVHTAIEEVTITRLLHKLEKGTNRKSKKAPAFAKKGMKIIAVLETEEPVCVETYEDYPHLGRFTLRDQGITIAIGKIVKLLE